MSDLNLGKLVFEKPMDDDMTFFGRSFFENFRVQEMMSDIRKLKDDLRLMEIRTRRIGVVKPIPFRGNQVSNAYVLGYEAGYRGWDGDADNQYGYGRENQDLKEAWKVGYVVGNDRAQMIFKQEKPN